MQRLVIEFDYVLGYELFVGVEVDLVARLEMLVDKSVGIEIVCSDWFFLCGLDYVWIYEELGCFAVEFFDDDLMLGIVVFYVFWVDGYDVGDVGGGVMLGFVFGY